MSDSGEGHITTTSDERLVIMANQIARFFASQPGDAATGVAKHLAAYWDPRMRAHIRAHAAAGGAGLDPIARDGVAALTR